MIIIRGRNEKSKWLLENFIDEKTLVFEDEYEFPPGMNTGFYVCTHSTKEVLLHFIKEYLEDANLREDFNKVVLYRLSELETANLIEESIKEHYPEFKVAIAVDTYDEELEIKEA